ncbi:hypothetical protein ACQ4LE_000711 [Meloidogyne hapla]
MLKYRLLKEEVKTSNYSKRFVTIGIAIFILIVIIKSGILCNKVQQTSNEHTIILIWNSIHKDIPNNCLQANLTLGLDRSHPNMYPDLSPNFTCPFKCILTRDRDFEPVASSILFIIHQLCPVDVWPQDRREEQNYIFYSIESPINTNRFFDRTIMTDTYFNSSATYRVDSAVFMPSNDAFTRITPDTPKGDIWEKNEILERIRNKSHFAYQAVTHCNAESGRDRLTFKLRELIPLDLAGLCFNGTHRPNWDYHKTEIEKYFFYLAFENSVCPNYVTEKFWFAIRAFTVPVVLTRSVFVGMDIPDNAFIAVDDFSNLNELVDHLKALRNDTEKYFKYFEWTKTYTKISFGINHSPLCKICELSTINMREKTKSFLSLNKFWNNDHCINDFGQKYLNKG